MKNELIISLIQSILDTINIMLPFFFIIFIVCLVRYIGEVTTYLNTTYFKEKKLPFYKVFTNKGLRGEYRTSQQFEKIFPGCKMLFNTYIKKNETDFTEIDIIVITQYAIFVVENKNYSGWIYGDEKSLKWCQTFGKNKKFFFYNPIKQNTTHMKCLTTFLDDNNISAKLISVICFNSNVEIKKLKINTPEIIVCKSIELNKYITNYTEELSDKTVNTLYNLLKPYSTVSNDTKQQHIDNINKKYNIN